MAGEEVVGLTGTSRRAEPSVLDSLMGEYRARQWLFVRPGGNWGDQLIYAGGEALADRCGLQWRNVDARGIGRIPADSVVYLHGGGGFNTWGSGNALRFLEWALETDASTVIQGPQTFESTSSELTLRLERLMARWTRARVVMIARERTSFEYLRSLRLPGIEIALDSDTALYLDRESVLRLAELDAMPRPRYALVVAREDDEAPVARTRWKRDVVTLDPAYVATSLRHWLRIHLCASTVWTNRLHSAIVAALAGIPVTLSAGSYHKNRSVYEYSLADHGVRWSDEAPPMSSPPFGRIGRALPRRLRESWKLGRLHLYLQRVPLN